MPELEDELRATTEDVAAEAADLQEIEEQKAQLRPDDPRMAQLSREAERIARRLVPKTSAQREIVDEVADPQQRDRRSD